MHTHTHTHTLIHTHYTYTYVCVSVCVCVCLCVSVCVCACVHTDSAAGLLPGLRGAWNSSGGRFRDDLPPVVHLGYTFFIFFYSQKSVPQYMCPEWFILVTKILRSQCHTLSLCDFAY